jgi:hypothetical protein
MNLTREQAPAVGESIGPQLGYWVRLTAERFVVCIKTEANIHRKTRVASPVRADGGEMNGLSELVFTDASS